MHETIVKGMKAFISHSLAWPDPIFAQGVMVFSISARAKRDAYTESDNASAVCPCETIFRLSL